MPSSTDTRYSARFELPELLERGTTCTIRCPIYRSGVLVAPTAGTVTLLDPGGVAVFEGEEATIPEVGADDDVATYTFVPATTLRLADGYTVRFTLTLAGVVHVFENDASVVRKRLSCPVADPDLYRIDSNLDPAGTDPISGTRTTWQPFIDEAWVQLQQLLLGAGNRPNLIASPSVLRRPMLLLTRALIYADFGKRQEIWSKVAKDLQDDFDRAWGKLQFSYADPESPTASTTRKRPARRTIWLGTRRDV